MLNKVFKNSVALFIAAVLCATTGCSKKRPIEVDSDDNRLVIVTSIFPIADIVSKIGGEHVDVRFLVQSGQSPHTFEPLPGDMKILSKADIVALVGFGFEFWADKMLSSIDNEEYTKIVFSNHIKPIMSKPHDHEDEDNYENKEESVHDQNNEVEANPHYWLSPRRAMMIASVVRDALTQKMPDQANFFSTNAESYILELKRLDGEMMVHTKGFSQKKFVASHSAWAYLASDYGLVEAGVIQEFPGKEPSPEQLARIIDTVRASKARAVFAEPQLSAKTAEVIAKEAGVKVAILDPLGGPEIEGRSSYLEIMRYNLNEMRKVMK